MAHLELELQESQVQSFTLAAFAARSGAFRGQFFEVLKYIAKCLQLYLPPDSTRAIIKLHQVTRIVVDTNIIVSAMLGSTSANRDVLRACLETKVQPIIGEPLFLEYEDVLARPQLMAKSPLSADERQRLLEAFLSVCEWVDVYFGWRPNLRDEHHNHLIELAVAGGANWIVTSNGADFKNPELKFPQISIDTASSFLTSLNSKQASSL